MNGRILHITLALLLTGWSVVPHTLRAQQPVKEKLERMASAQVAQSCVTCRITAEARWMPGDLSQADSSAVRALRLPASTLNRGYLSAEVIWAEGASERSSSVQFHIAVEAPAPVATRRIGEGEELDESVYRMQRMEITRLRELPAGGPAELKGRTASRFIQKGEVILRTDIDRPATVEHGDPVNMHYRGEGMAITLSTTARESKAPGEQIRLYCKETGKTYIATLINANEAKWKRTL